MKLEYRIPDLADLHRHSGVFLLERVFRGGGPAEYRAYGLVVNFIRLADLSAEEYTMARRAVFEFAERTDAVVHPIIPANHFEAAIMALERASGHLMAIRGSDFSPMTLRRLLEQPLTVLSSGARKTLKNMRDAIQHLDDKIRTGKIAEREPLMPLFEPESIVLGPFEVRYADMAIWIRELNRVSGLVAGYREEPSGPSQGA